MIEEQARDLLRSYPAIRNRVDKGESYPGVYASTVPSGHRGESIVIQEISGGPFNYLDGETGVWESMLQITTYSSNPKAAKTLSDIVRDKFSGFKGMAGDKEPTYIQSALIEPSSCFSDDEAPLDGSDKWFHKYNATYRVLHTVSVPTLA